MVKNRGQKKKNVAEAVTTAEKVVARAEVKDGAMRVKMPAKRNVKTVAEVKGEDEKVQAQAEIGALRQTIWVSATEFQNHFSKYRKAAQEGSRIIVTVGGKEELEVKKYEVRPIREFFGIATGQLTDVDAHDVGRMKAEEFERTGHI